MISGGLAVLGTIGFSPMGAGVIFPGLPGPAGGRGPCDPAEAVAGTEPSADRAQGPYEDEVYREEEDARTTAIRGRKCREAPLSQGGLWPINRRKSADPPLDEPARPGSEPEARPRRRRKSRPRRPPPRRRCREKRGRSPPFSTRSHVRRPDEVLEELSEEAAAPAGSWPRTRPSGSRRGAESPHPSPTPGGH